MSGSSGQPYGFIFDDEDQLSDQDDHVSLYEPDDDDDNGVLVSQDF